MDGSSRHRPATAPLPPLNAANLYTGDNIGFVVEGIGGDRVIGRLMVRRDGKWMEAEFKPGNVPLLQR